MARNRVSAKDVMKPHSEAKVHFYQMYLETHLMILSKADFVKEMHVYDLFCGRGIYADGKKGSAIRAYESIMTVREKRPSDKRIVLHLNDKNPRHIEQVREYIDSHYDGDTPPCEVVYTSNDAGMMLSQLAFLNRYRGGERGVMNVFFIDPYGYKDIKREFIEHLMGAHNTDILLFLPISFMHRFTRHAFSTDVTPGALPLKNFIASYFGPYHPMRNGTTMDVQQYIDYLTEAFSCGGHFFATSYPIERNENNHFALFFLSTSIFGYQKVLDLKWQMVDSWGFGFHLPGVQKGLFDEVFKQERLSEMSEQFRVVLIEFMSNGMRTNKEIYNFAVRKGFLPKHANNVLRELQNSGHLQIIDLDTRGYVAKKNCFHVDYKGYKNPTFLFQVV